MKKLIVALASLIALSGSHAATYTIGDANSIYLGFYSADSVSTESVLINIGSPDLVLTGYTIDMSGVSSVLSSTYGSGWHTNSDVYWSVIGRVSPDRTSNNLAWVGMGNDQTELTTPGGTNITAGGVSGGQWGTINNGINNLLVYAASGAASLSTTTNSAGDVFQISVVPNSGSSFNVYASSAWSVFTTPVDPSVTTGLDIQQWTKSGTTYINQTTFGLVSQSNGIISVSAPPLPPATYVWTASDGVWNDISNWSNSIPVSGATPVFAGAGGNSTNDIAGLSLTSLVFSNSAGSYTLSGSNLVVGGIVNNSSTNQTISLGLGFTNNATINAVSGSMDLSGDVALSNGATVTIAGSFGTILSGAVSGNGSLIQSGSGTTTLSGSNSFSGSVAVNAGKLALSSGNDLSSGNAVTVAGGELSVDANNTASSLTIGSGLVSGSGTLTAATYALNGGTVSGNLGAGSLTVGGSSTLSGTAAAANVSITSGSLTLAGNNLLPTTASVGISNGATLNLGSSSQTLAALSGSGQVSNNGTLTLNSSSNSSFGGSFAGNGSLAKSGTGTVTWSGDSSAYSGSTLLSGGAIALGGKLGGTLTVTNGGTLSGSGTLSSLTVANGGSVNPGNSPGNLTVSNTLSLNTGGILNWEINNWTGSAGTNWDLITAGSLNIGASAGNTFVINVLSDNLLNFSTNASSFQFLTYTNSPSFDATAFTVNYSSFAASNPTATGIWTVTSSGTGLWLNYTNPPAVPFVWATNSGSWSTASNWTNNASPSSTASVIFSGSGGNSTNDIGNLRLTSLTFSNTAGAYVISGTNFTLAGAMVNNSATNQSISNNVALGSAASLNAASSSLTIGGNIDLSNNSLTITGSQATSLEGGISGSGSLVKSGTGTATLSASNSYVGGTTLNAGTLVASNSSALGNSNNSLAVNGGTLDLGGTTNAQGTVAVAGGTVQNGGLNATNFQVQDGSISANLGGSGSMTKSGSGTATLSGGNSYTGGTTINGGSLVASNSSALGNSTNSLAVNAGTLDLGGTTNAQGTVTVAGGTVQNGGLTATNYQVQSGSVAANLNGTASLTKSGSGTVTLSGSNGYTGGTTLNEGHLLASNSSALGNSTNSLAVNGGTLDLGGTTNTQGMVTVAGGTVQNGGLNATNFQVQGGSISANLGGIGSLTKSGTGTVTLSGSNSFNGSVAVNAGKLSLASGNALSSGNAVTVAGGDLSVDVNNSAASLTISAGVLSGSGTLTAATYTLNGGTVSGNLGAGSLSVGGSSTLSGTAAAADVGINSGSLTLAGNNRLSTTASVGISNGATLNLGSNSQTIAALSGSGQVSNNGSLSLNGSASSSFSGSIAGSGSLTKNGSGTLTLSGSNSYTGGTLISGGELALNSIDALSHAGAISIDGGVLNALTNFQTAGVVSLNGGSVIGSGSLSASGFSLTSGMASAVLAGNASLTKSGTGTVTLTGANSYMGGTTLNAGVLVASNASALGNSTNSLAVNGGTLDLAGTTNAQGTVTVAAGTVTNGGLSATNYQVLGGDISASLGGTASLTKTGSGTATLSASNGYTGGTTVSAGALRLIGASATLGASTNALSVAGGLLDLGATNRTVGAFTLSGGSVTNGTLAASSYALQSGVLHSALSGSGSLTKTGSGTVSLHAANSGYSGGVSINNGTLQTFATNALGSGSVALSGSSSSAQGVLALQTNLTIASLNWGSNGVIALTPGAMTLNILGLMENSGGGIFDFGSFSSTGTNTIATFAASTNFTTNSFSVLNGGQWGFDLTSTTLSAFYLGGGSITNNSNAEITNSTTNSTTTVTGGTTEITAGVTLNSTNSVNVEGGNIVNYGNIVTPLVSVTSGGLGVAVGATVTASDSVTVSGNGSVIQNNGEITTPLLAIDNGGTLKGSGVLNGDLMVQGGNLSPGNSPGTITINGNYSVSSGALNIEVASPSNYDRVVVSGAAALGGALNLIPYDGYVMQFGDAYTFLTASGGISGSYSATNTPAGIRARLLQSQNSLTALIAPTSYTQVAVTQNQVNVAKALDTFIPATSGDKLTVSTALDSLTASQYSGAFEAIQPTIYQSLSTLAFNNANAQNMQLVQRLWNQRIAGTGFSMSGFADNMAILEGQGDGKSIMDPNKDILRPGPDNKWGLFVDGNGIFAQANSGNMLPNYNAQGGGVTTGVTYRINPVVSVGTYVGYQGTYAKYNAGSSMTDNSVRFGGFATYGRQDGKGFFADALVGGGYNNYQVTRNIQFGSINRTATSAPGAGELDTMVATGYDLKKGKWTFGPTASLQYTYFGANSFSENGAQSLNLSNSGWNTSSMLSSLGAHAAYTWQAGKDLVVVPQVNLSWQHEFLQDSYSIDSSVGGASFANTSSTPIRDFLYTGIGFTVEYKNKWNTSFFYNAAAGNNDLQSQNIFWSLGAKF